MITRRNYALLTRRLSVVSKCAVRCKAYIPDNNEKHLAVWKLLNRAEKSVSRWDIFNSHSDLTAANKLIAEVDVADRGELSERYRHLAEKMTRMLTRRGNSVVPPALLHQYPSAESLYEQYIKLAEEYSGNNRNEEAAIMFEKAGISLPQHELRVPLAFKKALEHRKREFSIEVFIHVGEALYEPESVESAVETVDMMTIALNKLEAGEVCALGESSSTDLEIRGLHNLGQIFCNIGEVEDALQYSTKAVDRIAAKASREPDSLSAYDAIVFRHSAMICQKNGDMAEAVDRLVRQLTVGPAQGIELYLSTVKALAPLLWQRGFQTHLELVDRLATEHFWQFEGEWNKYYNFEKHDDEKKTERADNIAQLGYMLPNFDPSSAASSVTFCEKALSVLDTNTWAAASFAYRSKTLNSLKIRAFMHKGYVSQERQELMEREIARVKLESQSISKRPFFFFS